MHYEIEFPLAHLSAESVETALLEAGATAITFSDRGDEPVLEPKPDEIRLWSDTLVRALFELADASREPAQTSAAWLNCWDLTSRECARVRAVESRDWERVWLKDWKPMRFGRRLWVCPTEAPAPEDPAAVVVRLDPGLAFGTGTHPTTALCLQMLDAMALAGPHPDRLRLRLRHPRHSRAEARRGARRRGGSRSTGPARDARECGPQRRRGPARDPGRPAGFEPASCVFANILADPLIELAPVLSAACLPRRICSCPDF